jgi:hypothetical protein
MGRSDSVRARRLPGYKVIAHDHVRTWSIWNITHDKTETIRPHCTQRHGFIVGRHSGGVDQLGDGAARRAHTSVAE